MLSVGRPSELTEELFGKIKRCILDGMTLRDLAKHCEISEDTIYDWSSRNYRNFSDKVEGWKRDRKLILADITSDTILTLPVNDENGKLDKELLRIKQKEAEFIRETLGKEIYSKRSELTGANGKEFPTPILAPAYVPTDNINKESNGNEETHQSSAGGNISQQDSVNSPILSSFESERQNTDSDERSSTEHTTPQERSDERLPEHPQSSQVLEG